MLIFGLYGIFKNKFKKKIPLLVHFNANFFMPI